MDSYGQNQYAYNHQNVRFKKQHENGYSLYYLDGSKMLAEYKYDLNDNLIHKYHYYYNALGIAGIEYNGKKYNYLTDGQGNISKVFFEGRMIGEYNYDSFGNDEINYLFPDDETERQLLRDNPFRWKSYYKDTETGLFLINTPWGSRYYNSEIGQFITPLPLESTDTTEVSDIDRYSLGVSNILIFPDNRDSISTSLGLKAADNGYINQENGIPGWLIPSSLTVLGIGLTFIPGAQIVGASLIISGLSGLAYHGLGSVGVDSQTAGMVVSGLNVVAGIGMLFTPLAPLGASMIGSGIGAVGFGYAVQALGGSYEIGSIIGGVAGGIAGGYIHRGIQYVKSYRFLRSNGVEPIKAKEIIDAFKGVPQVRKVQADTTVYRVWGGDSGKFGHWVSPNNYGSYSKSLLSLPPGNTMAQTSKFIMNSNTKVLIGTAAPLYGQPGGGVQWWVIFLK